MEYIEISQDIWGLVMVMPENEIRLGFVRFKKNYKLYYHEQLFDKGVVFRRLLVKENMST